MRNLTFTDRLLDQIDQGLRTSFAEPAARRPNPAAQAPTTKLVDQLYLSALGRVPTDEERSIAAIFTGSPATAEGVTDLLWALTMLPEFQLVH